MGTPLPDQEHQRDRERAAEDDRRPRAQRMEPRGGLRLGLRLGLAAQLDGELIQHDLLGQEQAVDLAPLLGTYGFEVPDLRVLGEPPPSRASNNKRAEYFMARTSLGWMDRRHAVGGG